MNYLTLKEAAEATGLNEATIRRLCKKPVSEPFIEMRKGKQGIMYTIQDNYLFDNYPPIPLTNNTLYQGSENDSVDKNIALDCTSLIEAKDDIIQLLKSDIAYLRDENSNLKEENRELKLMVSSVFSPTDTVDEPVSNQSIDQVKKNLWQRLFS